MVSKELVIILASCFGGAFVIMAAMSTAGGGQPLGTYTGNSNAAHMVISSTNCYSFQTGCENSNKATPISDSIDGANLGADYKQP
ncbi:MAG: hypothetical protein ACYDAJ_08815 [Nitrosotalea sp.]